MASLYCMDDGIHVYNEDMENHDSQCQTGDLVQHAIGRLISGPWRCDRCNALLEVGDEVIFTRILYHGPDENAYESEYINLEYAKIEVFMIPARDEGHEQDD